METKKPLESKTIIAAIVGLISYYLLNFTNVDVTEDELMKLAEHVFVIGSLVVAAWGRYVANSEISFFKDDSIKVDLGKMTEDEKNLFLKLMEKSK